MARRAVGEAHQSVRGEPQGCGGVNMSAWRGRRQQPGLSSGAGEFTVFCEITPACDWPCFGLFLQQADTIFFVFESGFHALRSVKTDIPEL